MKTKEGGAPDYKKIRSVRKVALALAVTATRGRHTTLRPTETPPAFAGRIRHGNAESNGRQSLAIMHEVVTNHCCHGLCKTLLLAPA
jgi:hypothetical protein